MKRRAASLLCHLAICLTVFIVWGRTFFVSEDGGFLLASGLGNLKYFTVLSNLLEGAASLIYALWLIRSWHGPWAAPAVLRRLHFAAATSVMLTFAVVMAFLGPVYGYRYMFTGFNLFFHLLVPLASAAVFCLVDRDGPVPFRDTFYAVLPMLLYGVVYSLNLIINGVGQRPNTNDIYGFARGGVPGAVLAFVSILVGVWGLALLIRLPRRKA